jgi:hypothetical protein
MSLNLLPVSVSAKIVDQKELSRIFLKLVDSAYYHLLGVWSGGAVSNIKIIRTRVSYVLCNIL